MTVSELITELELWNDGDIASARETPDKEVALDLQTLQERAKIVTALRDKVLKLREEIRAT